MMYGVRNSSPVPETWPDWLMLAPFDDAVALMAVRQTWINAHEDLILARGGRPPSLMAWLEACYFCGRVCCPWLGTDSQAYRSSDPADDRQLAVCDAAECREHARMVGLEPAERCRPEVNEDYLI